jgi:hypothetical protein
MTTQFEIHSKLANSNDEFEIDVNLPVRLDCDKKHAYNQVKELNHNSNGRYLYKVVKTK